MLGLTIAGFVVAVAALFFVVFSRQRYDAPDQIRALWRKTKLLLGIEKKRKYGTVTLEPLPSDSTLTPPLPYSIGNLQFPIVVFIGGDGTTSYRYPDGIETLWSASRPALPDDVQEALPGFLKKRLVSRHRSD